MFTAEMFAPILTEMAKVMPIAIGAGAGLLAITFVGKKGFTIIKGFLNKG